MNDNDGIDIDDLIDAIALAMQGDLPAVAVANQYIQGLADIIDDEETTK